MGFDDNYLLFKAFAVDRDWSKLKRVIERRGYPQNDSPGELSLLVIAIQFADFDLIKFLLSIGYSTDLKYEYGGSVFHEALELDDDEKAWGVFYLLQLHGSPGDQLDVNGNTIADLVARRGFGEGTG